MSTKPITPAGAYAVTHPGLAWHAGHANAYQQTLAAVNFHLPNIERLDAEQLRRGIERLQALLTNADHTHWRDALSFLARTPAEVNALLEQPRPAIEYDDDEATPMVIWDDVLDATPDACAIIPLPHGFSVTTPFRQVRTKRLPEGTQLLPIQDASHAALATACESWGMLASDVERTTFQSSGETAWARLPILVDFYGLVLQRISVAIPREEFADLDDMPVQMSSEQVPQVIANSARTSRARQFIAISFAKDLLQDQVTALEAADVSDEQRFDAVRATIGAVKDAAVHELRAANQRCIDASGHSSVGMVGMVVLRPIPPSGPVLALIPESAIPPIRAVSAR